LKRNELLADRQLEDILLENLGDSSFGPRFNPFSKSLAEISAVGFCFSHKWAEAASATRIRAYQKKWIPEPFSERPLLGPDPEDLPGFFDGSLSLGVGMSQLYDPYGGRSTPVSLALTAAIRRKLRSGPAILPVLQCPRCMPKISGASVQGRHYPASQLPVDSARRQPACGNSWSGLRMRPNVTTLPAIFRISAFRN
jgi:hypothetical protein